MKLYEILEKQGKFTIVKVFHRGFSEFSVMSGEVLEENEDHMVLKLMQNDSLLIERRIILLWDGAKRCFIRV